MANYYNIVGATIAIILFHPSLNEPVSQVEFSNNLFQNFEECSIGIQLPSYEFVEHQFLSSRLPPVSLFTVDPKFHVGLILYTPFSYKLRCVAHIYILPEN